MTSGGLTATHPDTDGTLHHFPRARLVQLAATLRTSGLRCTLSIGTRMGHVEHYGSGRVQWTPTTERVCLVIAYGPGVLRVDACAPTAAGTRGSVVDLLPVEGQPASRPLPARPSSDATKALDLRALRKALRLAHGGYATPTVRDTDDDWTDREAEALAVLGPVAWQAVQA